MDKPKKESVDHQKEENRGEGKRFDDGKLRYDLVPAYPLKEIAQVFTFGATKYGPRNWEKGMSWSRVIGSMERHIQAFKMGRDLDPETGIPHLAHAACNMMFLLEYSHTYPEGDDRPNWFLKHPKIGLDIDDVIADFISHYEKTFHIKIPTTCWDFDPDMKTRLLRLKDNEDFWMNVPVKFRPEDIPFEPECYITSRVCDNEITKKWLRKNGFPMVPVYQVKHGERKSDVAKRHGITWFVDDRYMNFVDMNQNGVLCFLLDAPHNQRYTGIGSRRIKTLKDLPLFRELNT